MIVATKPRPLLHRHCIIHQRVNTSKAHISGYTPVRVCSLDDQLLPEFVDAFSTYVCDGDVSCLRTSIVPSYLNQVIIINEFHDIMRHVDVSNVLPTVFKLLMLRDQNNLQELINALQSYYATIDTIRSIVKATDAAF